MKMQRATTPLAVAALTALLAGCGGGGHSSSTLPSVPKYSGPMASAVFSIQLPQRSGSSTTRLPQYISVSTRSLGVVVTLSGNAPGPLQKFNLGPGQPSCSGTPVTCTITIDAPVGSDTFDFTLYDGLLAAGTKLSHGTQTATIVAGTANTVPTTTLNGIVASFTLSQGPWTKVFLDAASGTQAYQITAQDAGSNTITGNYDQPVNVTTFDAVSGSPSSFVSLSQSQFAKSGDTITATVDGTKSGPQGATLNFAVGLQTVATATIAIFPATLPGGAAFDPTTFNNQAGLSGDSLKLVGWYDAQDVAKMSINNVANVLNVNSANVVTALKDKSGNTFDLSPGAVVGPTYDPVGGPAKHPALDFASAKCLSRTTGFPISTDPTNHGDYTILVMVRQPQLQNFMANILSGGYGTAGGHLFWINDINGHLGLARAGATNTNYARALSAPPPGSFLAEGDYNAQKTHMGSVFQGSAAADTGGEFSLSGTFGIGKSIVLTVNGTAFTYAETVSDTSATSAAANLVNWIKTDPTTATLRTIIDAATDSAAPDRVLVTQVPSGPGVTTFSVSSTSGTTTDQTITDNPADTSFALNCYNDHLDSSSDNHIEEVVIYNGLLTSVQRGNLQTYFLRKWSQIQ